MLRVRTLYATAAHESAEYYARYVEPVAGEQPGQWQGGLAEEIDVPGAVEVDPLKALLKIVARGLAVAIARSLMLRPSVPAR